MSLNYYIYTPIPVLNTLNSMNLLFMRLFSVLGDCIGGETNVEGFCSRKRRRATELRSEGAR